MKKYRTEIPTDVSSHLGDTGQSHLGQPFSNVPHSDHTFAFALNEYRHPSTKLWMIFGRLFFGRSLETEMNSI